MRPRVRGSGSRVFVLTRYPLQKHAVADLWVQRPVLRGGQPHLVHQPLHGQVLQDARPLRQALPPGGQGSVVGQGQALVVPQHQLVHV